jgi:hypothetical protein
VLDTRLDCGGLTEVAAEPDHSHTWISASHLKQTLGCGVSAPIVDVDDLVGATDAAQSGCEPFVQRDNVVLLVE